ncbi:unnamed protein product [Prorocentrum cordatum]|uniref:Uncharacterized protein n=1 Tax=Prorocentrum cordatum TaxID=2364126 RepID=A0ABN9VH11_9DINO|nr:unnamed protein product [Polarella glacialis]
MGFQQKPGDWNCPACGDLQFAKNTACRRHQTKPGDWNCPACGDLQFARNTNCRKCGAGNPAGAGAAGAGGCGGGGGGFGPAAAQGGEKTSLYIRGLPEGLDPQAFQKVIEEYGALKTCKIVGNGVAYVAFQNASEAEWVVTNLDGNIPEGLDVPVKVTYAQASAGAAGGPYNGKGAPVPQATGGVFGGVFGGMMPQPAGGMAMGGGGCMGGMVGGKGCAAMGAGIQTIKKMLMAADMLPGGRWTNNDKTVVVKNLPDDCSDKDLYDMFCPFGPIHCEGVRALHWDDGRSKGTAFVNFVTLEAAVNACAALNNLQLPSGMLLKVYRNEDGGGGGAGGEMKPGDWACPACGDMQFARNANCRKCGTANPSGPPTPGQYGGGPQVMPGDWSCPACGDLQFARNTNCRRCGAGKPADAGGTPGGFGGAPGGFGGGAAFSAGDWNCPACGDHQFARNMQCRKCGTPRPS